MTLAEAIPIVVDHLAWRKRVYAVGEIDKQVIAGLEVVLEAARLQLPPEDHDQDHGAAGEWDEPGSGQPITEANP